MALELENLVLVRDEQPDLPIANIPKWTARVDWEALLSGRLVNDQYIERPTFRITRTLAKQEAQDEVPVAERGWQEAVESIYPFKINQVRIVDADLTYLDETSDETSALKFKELLWPASPSSRGSSGVG